MKFQSKLPNYAIVLKTSIQGNPLTGQPSIPGVSALFKDFILTTEDPKLIKMILSHKKCTHTEDVDGVPTVIEGEFWEIKETDPLPCGVTEPQHHIIEMNNGRMVGNPNPAPEGKMTRQEAKKLAEEMAREMVKEMVPGIVSAVRKEIESEPKEAVKKSSYQKKKDFVLPEGSLTEDVSEEESIKEIIENSK
jgi:hypothetical protein